MAWLIVSSDCQQNVRIKFYIQDKQTDEVETIRDCNMLTED